MNLQPVLRARPGFVDMSCPVAEDLWQRGMYLPSSNKLGDADVDRVAGAIKAAAGYA
jgi:perosamine synthetase